MESKRPTSAQPSSSNDPNQPRRTRSTTGSLPAKSRNESVLQNLLQGKPASRQTTGQVEDVPPTPTIVATTHQEVDKIQQICQQESEPIRQQVSHIEKNMSAIAQSQDPMSIDNTTRQIEALRTEFSDKIDALIQAQPDVSKLVEELFVVRRDLNSVLETQSQVRRIDAPPQINAEQQEALPKQEGEIAEENMEQSIGSQRQYNSNHRETNQGSKRKSKATSSRSTRNRRYELSSDSESAESHKSRSDMDRNPYSSEDEQPTIPFHERSKGPQHFGLTVIKPADPAFDRLMN